MPRSSSLNRILIRQLLAWATLAMVPVAFAQQHMHEHATEASRTEDNFRAADTRHIVAFPAALKEHELANMRDHLLTLAKIQEHLSKRAFDKAGDLAEKRLGMSSFGLHGAHEVAPYMPKGMQDLGTALHHAASRFAISMQEASINDDLGKALAELTHVTQTCIACHAAYGLK